MMKFKQSFWKPVKMKYENQFWIESWFDQDSGVESWFDQDSGIKPQNFEILW